MDQPKIERMLKIMMLLINNHYSNIDDLAVVMDTSSRTIYRYIDSFRNAGFIIKMNKNNVPIIDKRSPYLEDISNSLYFTEEESYILKSAIESIDDNNILKQNLKKKLYSLYNYKVIADVVVSTKNKKNVNNLVDAINNKKQVVLHGYNSAHSNTVSDRIVEPFVFTTNYIQVCCYERTSKMNKMFKVARISNVELLDEDWQFASEHKMHFIDIFRISTPEQPVGIKLLLNLRAANLLLEEFPLSKNYMTYNDNKWLLETNVSNFEGVGRFIMGLYHDINIIAPDELKIFIKNKMKEGFENLTMSEYDSSENDCQLSIV
ncbi:MAG: WYL domain-containing protein [Bacteroidales bacterium]|jgi:predicted DNA-binding transcriptional regulator YafY|nr:WYL domain-containing protein [Bacteroidales bacterium]MDD3914908.1 WYL domain-containing protein [Bacteroidales bacterium]MDD4634760.1 WYL domain-containing protein [Bacteroidales bacterium]